MYCVVVWQRVICMVCVMCGGVAACHRYGLCTVWWCGCVLCVWCVYCVEECQRVLGTFFVLCGGVAESCRYVSCTVWWCGSVS